VTPVDAEVKVTVSPLRGEIGAKVNWATGSARLEAGAARARRNANATHGHTPAGVMNLSLRFVTAIVALLFELSTAL
jgi:hypothetical protein